MVGKETNVKCEFELDESDEDPHDSPFLSVARVDIFTPLPLSLTVMKHKLYSACFSVIVESQIHVVPLRVSFLYPSAIQ